MIPVVFVHGFMGGSKQWQAQLDALADVDTYSVDLPGFGANAHMEGFDTIEKYAAWVLSHLKSKGVTHFHLIGHSMGGMVAQEMVARSPNSVARLVLYGTGSQGVLPGRFETIETSKKRALSDGAQVTARRIAATWFLNGDRAVAYEACAAIAERSRIQAILAGARRHDRLVGCYETFFLLCTDPHCLGRSGSHISMDPNRGALAVNSQGKSRRHP